MFRTTKGLKKKDIVGSILAVASLIIFATGLASCNLGRVNPAGESQQEREDYENPRRSDDDDNNERRNRQENRDDDDDDNNERRNRQENRDDDDDD
ncbi:hypothetical protein U2718_014965 [Chlorogloeopsis sp. ULAP02]